ncbi:DUF305 domain-containing protein [Nocardioides okcheonensis]|uniref:DUF305 domain-containing protein n=1 Tax=Nocardioides okcheonensis TaxID=2894081 RepID=UPI001E33FEAB|nr:DUF305 domain-containing protein [Nocardioides okcheonensis]UFN45870.1 DUF305 domain-containing protein [Nocardioides okcheonensis]
MTVNSRDSVHRGVGPAGALRACGLLLACLALTSCSGGDDGAGPPAADASGSPSPSVTVLQPGSPGEAATTGGPVELPEGSFNHSDVAFVQMMVPHHAQALEMADLAADRASSRPVRVLASRIRAAQGPEIVMMSSWLEEHDLDVPAPDDDPMEFDHSAHGHDPMMGMLTPAQMDDLAQASGARFDRLFLRGMVQHHQGALDMAQTVAVDGEDLRVAEMAADIDVTQRVEIQRMQDLLAGSR